MTVASAAAVGPPPGMSVRLSSNESPFGPSPAAVTAAAEVLEVAHLYPDDQSVALRTAIADAEGCALDEVAVGTGSAALLMDAVGCVCQPDDAVLTYERAFVVYRLAARNAGARYVEAPTAGPATLEADGYARDPAALLDRLDASTALVVIDNPGNPTGAALDGDALSTLVSRIPDHVTVVIDEAYHQFAVGQRGYATVAELGLEHPRLLTLRTFSKAYALAGLRIGYVRGPAELVAAVDAYRTRFNVTATAQAAAIASLGDDRHLRRAVDGTIDGRATMATGLRAIGIPVTEGLGNFVTIELGVPAGPVVEAYAARGIGVRPLAPYGMHEQLRVSVGTPREVATFLEVSQTLLPSLVAG